MRHAPADSHTDSQGGGYSLKVLVPITVVAVFAIENLIMLLVLPGLPPLDPLVESVLDSFLIALFLYPVLHFSFFRPMLHNVQARMQVERDLRAANHALERRNAEAQVLAEMDGLLSSAYSLDESYGIIRNAAQQLFPQRSGALMMLAESKNYSEKVLGWGGGESLCDPADCNPENCWGLRLGGPHRRGEGGMAVACCACARLPARRFACVPMSACGETMGVACLQSEADELSATECALYEAMVRRIAIALANLRLKETLRRQSLEDPLTGLFNRRYMMRALEQQLHRAARTQSSLGVIMLDLDHFKRLNDTHGHDAGDAVLRELAGLLKRLIRLEDVACRYGGEEFALIMPDVDAAVCRARCEIMLEAYRKVGVTVGGELLGGFTMSVGMAIFPDHGRSLEALLLAADQALYRAKQTGRDRLAIAEAGTQPAGQGAWDGQSR